MTQHATPSAPTGEAPRAITASGTTILYRLYDVGYSIDLRRAQELLSQNAPERARPLRAEARAIQIPDPPLRVLLEKQAVEFAPDPLEAEASASIFSFGVVSVRLAATMPPDLPWMEFCALGSRMQASAAFVPAFQRSLEAVMARIGPAVRQPALSPAIEEYAVFRVNRLGGPSGVAASELLSDSRVASLLLADPRPLSTAAMRELLPHRFSYYADELAVVTWDNALLVEPNAEDHDVQFVLEFANAQLLELRVFDGLMEAEVSSLYRRMAGARRHSLALLSYPFRGQMRTAQTLVSDTTDLVERLENSFKITDDIYLARVYSAALEVFRARAWRAGIDRKLTAVRETYTMLAEQARATRSEVLEIIIVLLILAEMVLAVTRR